MEKLVHWREVTFGDMLGEGRMGAVWAGTYQGHEVAVKVVDISKKGTAALSAERQRYKQLSHLQGVCIPQIIRYNFGSDIGVMDGFIMQKLRPMNHDFEAWTQAEIKSSEESLKMLAELGGLMQKDCRGANFGLDERTSKVLVLDLEDLVSVTEPTHTNGPGCEISLCVF